HSLYTDEARSYGIEGTVTIMAEVSTDGEIKGVGVLKGLSFGLDEVAAASVREWALSPATRNGAPVSVIAQIDVEFNLRSATAFRMGAGMIAPTVQHRVEPQYNDEARSAGYNGTCCPPSGYQKGRDGRHHSCRSGASARTHGQCNSGAEAVA